MKICKNGPCSRDVQAVVGERGTKGHREEGGDCSDEETYSLPPLPRECLPGAG